jgi:cell division protein FtsI (penicillin-binding protein 3)
VENAELAQEVQTLQQRVIGNGTPAALAAAATAAGLVPAGSAAYLVIAPDGSSTLRGTVTPAPEPVKPTRVPADKD